MIPETRVHTIARQMLEQHGYEAIAQVARKAQECENRGGGRGGQGVAPHRRRDENHPRTASELMCDSPLAARWKNGVMGANKTPPGRLGAMPH